MRLRYLLTIGGVLLGFVFIGGLLFLSGPLPAGVRSGIRGILPASPDTVRQIVAVVLTVGGIAFLLLSSQTAEDEFAPTDPTPEASQRPPAIAGDEFEASVEQALDEIRLQGIAYAETEPHSVLRQVSEETIRSAQDCSAQEANNVIARGSWTGDAVAQAFLSESITPPVTFRLLRWVSPVEAYRYGLSRTVRAVTQLINADVSAAPELPSNERTSSAIATALREYTPITRIVTGVSGETTTGGQVQANDGAQSDEETQESTEIEINAGEE
jgi:hypothetical protein